jgi:hypothetical protein
MESLLLRMHISSRSVNKHGRCLLMNRDKMSNLYREPSIDASYQVSVHLASGYRGHDFYKSTN